MPASATATAMPSGGSAETVLRLLARAYPNGLALLASRGDEHFMIEEAHPNFALAGRTLQMPHGLIDDKAVLIDVAKTRISLGWTEACTARPTYLAAVPIAGHALHLVLASCNAERPMLADLSAAADAIARILGHGQTTRHMQNTSHRIAALVDNLPVPLIFVDSRTIEVFLNDRARTLLGITAEDMSERAISSAVAKLVAGSIDRKAQLSSDPIASMIFEVQHTARHFEVESRWIEEERLSGRMWLFRDVTDERQVARFKDELVSTVSHELRTPLTSIVGSLALLKADVDHSLSPAATGLVDIAQRNGERLTRLINDLLDLDKLHSGKLETHFEHTDVVSLLRETIEQNAPYAHRHGVTLHLALPGQPVSAMLDAGRIQQVLTNLISNAAKFAPERSEVRVRLATTDAGLRISVIDQGQGISPEFQARLFTRFAQEPGQSRSGQTGTGLGLAISKGIIEQHGGTIMLDTEPAIGATFHIDLPARPDAINRREDSA